MIFAKSMRISLHPPPAPAGPRAYVGGPHVECAVADAVVALESRIAAASKRCPGHKPAARAKAGVTIVNSCGRSMTIGALW